MSWQCPVKLHQTAWMALLDTCRNHGNVEMAECVAKRILEMGPDICCLLCAMLLLPTGISVRMLNC